MTHNSPSLTHAPQQDNTLIRRLRTWFRTSIRAQFSAISILLAVVPMLIVTLLLGGFVLNRTQSALRQEAFAKLASVRVNMVHDIQTYFAETQQDLDALVETVGTLRQEAFDKLDAVNQAKSDELARVFEDWDADVRDVSSDPGVVLGMEDLAVGFRSLGEKKVRSLYLGKEALEDAGDGSAYSAAHVEQHGFFVGYTGIHGYLDAFLVDLAGNVVYSVHKGEVFGTNLASGPYQDSNLAELYQGLIGAARDQVYIADAAPFDDEMTMFVGSPVYRSATQVGILVYQVPLERINTIVQARTGLEESAESYLVGKTGDVSSYRSDRVVKEGKIGEEKAGDDVDEALSGISGHKFKVGSTGNYEITAYAPLQIPGLNWAILSTASVEEIVSPKVAGREKDYFTQYAETYGYYDLLLIAPDGYTFFTFAHEPDYETNLLTGPYKDTNLGRLVAEVLKTKQFGVADFEVYAPSGDVPAAFMAQPVLGPAGQVEVIVAVQLPVEGINAIMQQHIGQGETGEAYLVGNDHLWRSDSRFLAQLGAESTILNEDFRVDTEGASQALAGKEGTGRILNYRGVPVFSAWQPLNITGLDWVVLAEVDEAEAVGPANQIAAFITGLGFVLLLIVGAISVGLGAMMASRLVKPVLELTESATAIAGGNLDVILTTTRQDEVGVLTNTFGTMTARLREMIDSLQARTDELAERTRELEASQRVTFAASERISPQELLGLVVNLIRDQFNLYHVQVYVLDEEQGAAVLRESTGYAGRQLLQQKHQIALDSERSLVIRSISEGEPVLVTDVSQDENFMPNPLLPDTESELVVPLKVGDEVIGALDAQDRAAGRFTESTIALFQMMADQISFLFENSELVERITEQTEALTLFTTQLRTAADIARRMSTVLDPTRLLQQVVELLQSRFGLYHAHIYILDAAGGHRDAPALTVQAGSGEVGRVLRERGHSIPLDAEKSVVARAARDRKAVLVDDTSLESDFMPNPLLPQTRSEMAVPLIVGDQVLGVLDVQDDQPTRFTLAELDTFSTLAGQVATALQNARLFEERQQAEEALREREEQFRTLVEYAPEAVVVLDVETGRFVDGNENAMQLYGLEREELLKMGPIDMSPPTQADGRPSAEAVVEQLQEALEGGAPVFEWTHRNAAGDDIPCEIRLVRMPAVGRTLVRGSVTDITARKQAEEERERFTTQLRTAADLAGQINTILDPSQLLREVVTELQDRFDLYHVHVYLLDEETHDLIMYAGSGEVGQTLLEQGHKIPQDREQSLVARAAREQEIVSVADTSLEPDFMPNPLLPETRSEVAVPLVAGNKVLGVFDLQDNQPNRFAQADLDIFSTLAGQITTALQNARLYDETQRTAERLRDVDRLKSEFLASMSHELRTPLNSILGYTEVMLMGIDGEIAPDTLEDAQAIYDNGQHLLRLINDILDLAKIEAGRMTLNVEEVEIEPLLDEVKTSNAGLLVNRPVEMAVEIEGDLPSIQADRMRLNQVLNNLVSNAVKFTEEGHITLRASGDNGWVCIEVEDTGVGISEADLKTIFEQFRQGDGSYKRRAEGTGLGLSITRHLVEMHGGTIEVRSHVGEGTTFTLRMPVECRVAAEVVASPTADEQEAGD